MGGLGQSARRWWPGLIPLVLLWLAAAWSLTPRLEASLGTAATASLQDNVLNRPQIRLQGRDVTLEADAFSEEGRKSAVAEVEAVPGVRLVADQTRLVPAVAPFTWGAERGVARLTLSGHAPLPAVRARILEQARGIAGGVEVTDQMSFGRGAPARFDAAVAMLLEQLGRLKDGKVALSGGNVSLSGMARDLGGREAIEASLRNLPEGFKVAENTVAAPPYIFQANKDPVAVTLTLSGYVPNNEVHAALTAAASRKFVDAKVTDNLKASIGAPQGFADAATSALAALSRLSTGTLTISDREVKLSGDAFYEVAAAQIRNIASELPRGWKAETDISVKPPPNPVDASVCQQLFSNLTDKVRIRFESGEDELHADSTGLLDRLVEIAQRCPSSLIEIGGHTDAAGDSVSNHSLSERRAQAVAEYFVKAGLPADRFTEVGYGSTQPLASNDTDEGRAQNRRIEFTVK